MAVKMRLMRMGKKKQPMYRVVVIDGRAPRNGRYIEQIGRYAPLEDPSLVEIDNERATDWLSKGAQPTEAVEKLLNISGAMDTMKVRTGQIHTVGGPAPTAEEAADEAADEADEEVADEEVAPEKAAGSPDSDAPGSADEGSTEEPPAAAEASDDSSDDAQGEEE